MMRLMSLLILSFIFNGCGRHESRNYGSIKGQNNLQGEQASTAEEFLSKAISAGDRAEFLKHLNAIENIDAQNREGRTFLIQSVVSNQPYFVQELLNRGADVYKIDSSGKSAMDYALENALVRIQLMLDATKSITYQEELFENVEKGATTNVARLLEEGVNPNVFNSLGETPLTMALKTFRAQKKSSLLLTALKVAEWDDKEFGLTTTDARLANQSGESPLSLVLLIEPTVTKNADINNLKKVKAALFAKGAAEELP